MRTSLVSIGFLLLLIGAILVLFVSGMGSLGYTLLGVGVVVAIIGFLLRA